MTVSRFWLYVFLLHVTRHYHFFARCKVPVNHDIVDLHSYPEPHDVNVGDIKALARANAEFVLETPAVDDGAPSLAFVLPHPYRQSLLDGNVKAPQFSVTTKTVNGKFYCDGIPRRAQ